MSQAFKEEKQVTIEPGFLSDGEESSEEHEEIEEVNEKQIEEIPEKKNSDNEIEMDEKSIESDPDDMQLANLSEESSEQDNKSDNLSDLCSESENEGKSKINKFFSSKIKIAKFVVQSLKSDKNDKIYEDKFETGLDDNLGEKMLIDEDSENQLSTKSKVLKLSKEPTEENYDILNYKKFKNDEFKKFFTNGLIQKPSKSSFVKFINFALFFRLGLYDISYLALGNLPRMQISLLITVEMVFLFMILKCQFQYKLFKTCFDFTRLSWQSSAILFWLFLAISYSYKE
jgi:hypothetical protein